MTSAKYVIQGNHPVRKIHHFGGMGEQENWVELEYSLRGENKKIYGDVMYMADKYNDCLSTLPKLWPIGYAYTFGHSKSFKRVWYWVFVIVSS